VFIWRAERRKPPGVDSNQDPPPYGARLAVRGANARDGACDVALQMRSRSPPWV